MKKSRASLEPFWDLKISKNLICRVSYACIQRIHYKLNATFSEKYCVYANRTQAKKIISNLVCAQLESKQFQEVNFLALIR